MRLLSKRGVGGCNFCDRNGEDDYAITVVEGQNISVRFCDSCLMRLFRQMFDNMIKR